MAILQPTLENELVLIRPLKVDDFEVLYEVANDPLIWEQHPADRYKKEEFRTFFEQSIDSKGALLIFDKKEDTVIGSSRFKMHDRIDTAVEIGWSFLARAYWGGQYNQSVKKLMIDHAFLHFEEVVFFIAKDNVRSYKAVEKIGAQITNDRSYGSTTLNNDLTYLIKKEDWYHV